MGDAVTTITIYKAIANMPGITLFLVSLFGLVVFVWKHKTVKSSYSFSFGYVTDWAVLAMIAVGMGTGGFLMIAKAMAPPASKCLLF